MSGDFKKFSMYNQHQTTVSGGTTMNGEQNEPMTEGLAAEYVKEEVAKLMVYKIQAYEQLIEISALKEVIRACLTILDEAQRTEALWLNEDDWAIIDKARKLLDEQPSDKSNRD